jgi:SAM-dependent methyltransferase
MTADSQVCRFCANASGNKRHRVREMMFGTKEVFDYLECASCGALSLATVPSDMSRYYPNNYYSLQGKGPQEEPSWRRLLKHERAKYALTGKGVVGKFLAKHSGSWPHFALFKEAGLQFNSSILDVGCGNGDNLMRFASDGFTNLTGVDPFVEKDLSYPNGVKIFKREIRDVEGQFDCVISNHSFEHMVDPVVSFKDMADRVKPGGVLLIVIPIAGSAAWAEYGSDWYGVDAPRHITIPSLKSMNTLATQNGLAIVRTWIEAAEDQFLLSEGYKRGLSMTQMREEGYDKFFTAEERAQFREKTERAAAANLGAQASFVMRKPTV